MECKDIKIGKTYEYRFVVDTGTEEQLNDCRNNDKKMVTVADSYARDADHNGIFLVENSDGFRFYAFGDELFDLITNY